MNVSQEYVPVTYFEAGRAPVDELNCPFGFYLGDSGVNVLRDNISAVKKTTSHIFTVSWVTLDIS